MKTIWNPSSFGKHTKGTFTLYAPYLLTDSEICKNRLAFSMDYRKKKTTAIFESAQRLINPHNLLIVPN